MSLDIKGSASTLFKIGNVSGESKYDTEKTVKNLYDKYPNADKVLLRSQLIYFYCTMLDNAKDYDTDKKFEKLTEMTMYLGTFNYDPKPKDKPLDISGRWVGTWNPLKDKREYCEILIQQKEGDLTAYLTLNKNSKDPARPYNGSIDGNSVKIEGRSKYEIWVIDAVVTGNSMDGKLTLNYVIDPNQPKTYGYDIDLHRED